MSEAPEPRIVDLDASVPKAFRDLLECDYRDYAYFGGRGAGKSHAVAAALVLKAATKPLRIVCARETQGSLDASVKTLIEDKIATFGFGGHFEALRDETRGRNGSRILYRGLSRNPDAIKSLEGADIFWAEEANRLSARSLRIVRPTLRKPGSRMIWTWNPEFDHDPVDRLFRGADGPPPDSLVRQVQEENARHLSSIRMLREDANKTRTQLASLHAFADTLFRHIAVLEGQIIGLGATPVARPQLQEAA